MAKVRKLMRTFARFRDWYFVNSKTVGIMARLFFARRGGGRRHTGSMLTDDNEGLQKIDRQYSQD